MNKTNETVATGETATESSLLPILLDKAKLKTLRSALGGDRSRFETSKENGSAYSQVEKVLAEAANQTTEKDSEEPFFGVKLMVRQGSESAPIENANAIVLATVGVRDKATSTNGIKAIVVFEAPTIQDFLTADSETARAFVEKVIERETADVAFATLRQPDMTIQDMENAVAGMPATVEDIVTTSRESGGVDTEAFDAMWTAFKSGVLKEKAPKLASALPTKPEVAKAMRSASYARANPQTAAIEEKGLFVKMMQMLIQLAPKFTDSEGNPDPVDASSIQDWLDTRDELNLQFVQKTISADDLEIAF